MKLAQSMHLINGVLQEVKRKSVFFQLGLPILFSITPLKGWFLAIFWITLNVQLLILN